MTNQGMSAEQAGKKWIEDNKDVWKAWMP
jgi:ABC-type proline/glycine betaine transport system substrate-binding protein